ncbi:MAG: zinc finger, SWIM-type [Gammaproteobacteria bacterium]|nr:zinc finger, SWIM-type [Gammaproteobacteria bacterium]
MDFSWKPYVPVAKRRERAARLVAKLKLAGETLSPITAARGLVAKTYWGKAWCQNLERYSDYSSRLPRGRTYLRNGSVIDLKIEAGEVVAQVMGSDLYQIKVKISPVPAAHWQSISRDCAQSIDSWVELLQGQLSTAVMERMARPGAGLFPSPKEITFSCSCPDAAAMCKHVAATLYGIGSRLDAEPELLFRLRKVDAKELVARAGEGGFPIQQQPAASRILDSSKLAAVFGLDLVSLEAKPPAAAKAARKSAKKSSRKVTGSTAAARKNKKKKGATARRQARV